MEAWRTIFRVGVELKRDDGTYLLPTRGLKALEQALEQDDARLLQGGITDPPHLSNCPLAPVRAACLIGFCGWKGDDLEVVNAVGNYFENVFLLLDTATGKETWRLMNWFDETPRAEMLALLLPEVRLALAEREGAKAVA